MSFANFDTVPPRTSLPSRVALALAHANFASITQPQVDSAEESVSGHVKDLLEDPGCIELWTKLKEVQYPNSELAKGTAALNGFRHYMVISEYFARVRMESIGRTGSYEDIKEFAKTLADSFGWSVDARSNCTKQLGVPADVVRDEKPSGELQTSVNDYDEVARTGDWLDMNIVQLPCIMGYYSIAAKLKNETSTIKDSPYYKLWIDANAGESYARGYGDSVNSHIDKLTDAQRKERWQGWVDKLFKACKNKIDFFRLGSTTPPYEIVKNGVYKIRSSLTDNPYLVPNSSFDSVITQKTDPGDSGKWTLANLDDGKGYTIHVKSGDQDLFLIATPGPTPHEAPKLSLSKEKKPWSLNPPIHSSVQNSVKLLFQLLVPGEVQWVLDVDITPTVVVAAREQDDKRDGNQSWLLE